MPALGEVAAGSGLARSTRRRRGRSVAGPRPDGAGRVFASMNGTVPAAGTSAAAPTGEHCAAAAADPGRVSAGVARRQSVPVAQTAG